MSKPRKRKSAEHVKAVRSAAARKRWDAMGAEERRDAVAPATAASPVNKITVTDYYVTEADGSITRYRMHKDQLLEVEHDVPIVFEIGE